MLISLLGYVVLGLLLALPLGRLLLWLATHYGLYSPPWLYLRPYVPSADSRVVTTSSTQQIRGTPAHTK